jgi:peptidoglycan hydrolase CwlO-like protein
MDKLSLKTLKGAFFTVIAFLLIAIPVFNALADTQAEINERERQIAELQRQIDEYQQQIESTRSTSKTLEGEISKLNAKIGQLTLEIKSLELSLKTTNSEIKVTETRISDASDKLVKHKNALAQYIQIAYETDRKSLTEVLMSDGSLSNFFNELNNIQITQNKLKETIQEIRGLKISLEAHQENLEDKLDELNRLKNLQQMEKKSLDQNKGEKNKLLKDTKGQESKYQELVKKTQKSIEALRSQITYLAQNGVTAEEAVKFGQLAAIATGIRPAYLIAVLEVESGLGRNVGKCNRPEDPPAKHWENIMHSRDFGPFQTVTSELGLDINNTAVSCPQYVNGKRYGWGGAMGPAQFIPSTWMSYRDEVSRILGRKANPWVIEDAFMAAAVKLARAGATAQTRTAEVAASKIYYSGKSNCSTAPCNSYANAIQRKATEIAPNL